MKEGKKNKGGLNKSSMTKRPDPPKPQLPTKVQQKKILADLAEHANDTYEEAVTKEIDREILKELFKAMERKQIDE